jgi:hypothetical protein
MCEQEKIPVHKEDMTQDKKFLCLVILRQTSKQLAEYEVMAIDWYYARHKAADKYREEHPEQANDDWYVDSLEL